MIVLTQAEHTRLAGTFLFCGAEEAMECARGDPRCLRAEVGKGTIIYDPAQFQRSLVVLLEGRVQVSKGALIISVLEAGDLFGAAALFQNSTEYATTITAQQNCVLLYLPQALVEELITRFPAVGRSYMAYLSGRIHFLSGKIDALIAGSAERKLAQYLLTNRRGGQVVLECSYTGLAQRLGMSRASLYRALDGMQADGLLVRTGKQMKLCNVEGLESV